MGSRFQYPDTPSPSYSHLGSPTSSGSPVTPVGGQEMILRFVVWIPHQALASWKAHPLKPKMFAFAAPCGWWRLVWTRLLRVINSTHFPLFFNRLERTLLWSLSFSLSLWHLHWSTTVAYPTTLSTHTHIVVSSLIPPQFCVLHARKQVTLAPKMTIYATPHMQFFIIKIIVYSPVWRTIR